MRFESVDSCWPSPYFVAKHIANDKPKSSNYKYEASQL